ncbi:MAG: hypothetical protein ABSH41_26310 [Syntrophobacteraceae bacterium]
MKRSFWIVLFVFFVGIFMVGCSCLPSWLQCGQVAQETPPPQAAVVTPAPAPPPAVVQPAPPLKQDRN